MESIIYIVLTVLLIVILVIIAKYNKLVKLFNKMKKAKSDIEICLNKRFDFEFVLDNSLDKIKNITQKSLDNIGHIAGDDSKDFINGFNRVFQGITKSDLTKENTLDKNLSSDYKDKFLEFKKKHNMSKGQEKEISKKRTFGLEK